MRDLHTCPIVNDGFVVNFIFSPLVIDLVPWFRSTSWEGDVIWTRSILEKATKLETELRATEPLKSEIHQARNDCQKLHLHSQELGLQVRTLNQELQRVRGEAQLVPSLQTDIETLQAELQRARYPELHLQFSISGIFFYISLFLW